MKVQITLNQCAALELHSIAVAVTVCLLGTRWIKTSDIFLLEWKQGHHMISVFPLILYLSQPPVVWFFSVPGMFVSVCVADSEKGKQPGQ